MQRRTFLKRAGSLSTATAVRGLCLRRCREGLSACPSGRAGLAGSSGGDRAARGPRRPARLICQRDRLLPHRLADGVLGKQLRPSDRGEGPLRPHRSVLRPPRRRQRNLERRRVHQAGLKMDGCEPFRAPIITSSPTRAKRRSADPESQPSANARSTDSARRDSEVTGPATVLSPTTLELVATK